MTRNPLRDAMPARLLSARWVIRGTLTLETALHLGGEADDRVDMPILRDVKEGVPLLPGTTLAGALRSALADRLAGYYEKLESNGTTAVAALFGGAQGDDEGSQSLLITFDALGAVPDAHSVEVRDGVAILPSTGVAEDGKKFDYEVLPAGTEFPVRLDLVLPASPKDGSARFGEKEILEYLAAALDAFTHDENGFGAKRSRGLGRVKALWTAKRFSLDSREDWMEWVLSEHERPFNATPDQTCIRDALEAAAPTNLRPLSLLRDARRRVGIDLELHVDHDILIRSPGSAPGEPDASHLRSRGTPIVPGTSLAGVMRAQALKIAKLIHGADAAARIDHLFGPRFEGRRPSGEVKPRASRLRVCEARLEGSHPERQTRNALDRFTQGVVDGALFDEQAEVGGQTKVRLELRNPESGEVGLVLLVLKDLLDGSLPLGGTSSVGRGVLYGSATITWYDCQAPRSARIRPGEPPTGEAADEVSRAIQEFHRAKTQAIASLEVAQ